MNNEEARKFVAAVFKDVWLDSNIDAFDKYYSRKVTGLFNGEPVVREDILEHFNFIRSRLSEQKFSLLDVLVEGNKIAFRYYYYALKDKKEEQHMDAAVIYHLEEGKIAKLWAFANLPIER